MNIYTDLEKQNAEKEVLDIMTDFENPNRYNVSIPVKMINNPELIEQLLKKEGYKTELNDRSLRVENKR